MKILHSISLIVFITLFAIGCGSGGDGGTTTPLNITTTVSGTVLDGNGDPVEGAEVIIMSDPVTVTTDANGFFSATVEIGTHSLEVKVGSILIHSEQINCEENTPLQLSNIATSYNPDNNEIDDDGDSYTENQGDCNDSDINIHPGAEEICGDGIDQDCSSSDLTCPIPSDEIDDDGDSYTENQGDCNDSDINIHPAAEEICGDGIDQNCIDGDLTCPIDSGGTPEITSPAPGSTLSGSSETFTWTAGGTSVNEWWLYVGTSAGGSDIDDSGSLGLNTSTTVSGLPTDGSTVHVRLWYRQGSSWPYVDFQYTASGTGGGGTLGITSPVSGSTLSGSSETFTWTAGGTSVDEWWLNVGTSAGGFDIDTGSLGLNTSKTVSGLPTDGSTVHVRLWYRQGSSWPYVDYQYTASGTGGGGTIEMTSPAPGSTLSGSSVTFTWTAGGTSVDEWWLNVGSSVGGYDIDSGSLGLNTSKTVSGLPTNGSTVYVRLEYRQGSSWESMDYQYTASGTGGGGTIRMLSPAPGSTLSWNTETFRWTAGGTHVSNWFLYLGSEQGSDDIYHNDSSGGNTTATVYDIPNDGRTIYVKLWYETGGWWRHINYQYTANANGGGGPLPLAYITSPAANSTLSCYQTFSWNDNGNPATDHWVDIGSYPYGRDLWESGSLGTSRSVTVSGLPAGITVYVRLSYYSKGSWHFTPNYAYTTPSGGC